jgi:integrase
VPGLYLRVREGGSRTFVIQWREGSTQRRSTVGKVGVLSLDEARKKARKLLVDIDDGKDPLTAKAQARVEGEQRFLALAEEYLERRAHDMKAGSLDQITRHLKVYWKPLHRLAVTKIDQAIIASELRAIAKDRGGVAADRARSTLSAFFAWLIGEGFKIYPNPVTGTNKSGAAKDRERVLSDAELVAIWNASDPETDYGRIVRLLMLTGQRRDEIADLRRAEIDWESRLIALPATRTKNGRAHDVPLSATALEILRGVVGERDYLFGRAEGGYSGFSRAKDRLDERCGVKEWTQHDMRRTMATKMADLGVEPHVIEAVLNHVSGHKKGVAGVYNRSTYATQKRAALDTWAGYIQTIIAKAEGANVVSIRVRT